MKDALGCFGLLVVGVLGAIWNGVVLSIMWGWLVVPTFGAPELSVAAAIGVSTLIAFLWYGYEERAQEAWGDLLLKLAVRTALTPAVYLGIAWVVSLFL